MRLGFAATYALFALVGAPAAQDAEGEPMRAPGLRLAFERDGGAPDVRVSRLAALHVPAGTAPTPFLDPGPFSAIWTGWLYISFRDRHGFAFEGNGELELRIDGEPVELGGDPQRLRKGHHALEVRYRSPASGAATARLLWSGSDFGLEPLPPDLLFHDPEDRALVEAAERRLGRELLATRQCTRCHTPPRPYVLGDGFMPELETDAPLLSSVGGRRTAGWMAQWIENPHALRPDTTMPRMFHGDGAARDASDVAAYLATLGAAPADPGGDPRHGAVLFAQLGCIGCHRRPDESLDAAALASAFAAGDERISLAAVDGAWFPGALAAFLLDPDAHHAWIGMPDFGLSEREAAALAAYLMEPDTSRAPLELAAGADPARGRELFLSTGCAKCHYVGETGLYRGPAWKDFASLERGCLGDDATARGAAPDFALSAAERSALRVASQDLAPLGRYAPAEFAERRIAALRCDGCHARDGGDAVWSRTAAEVAELHAHVEPPELAQIRPDLSWAGEKLRDDWLTARLRGEVSDASRPWLRARMPAFPAAAKQLAQGLAAQHGHGVAAGHPAVDPDLVQAGRRLLDAERGFNCAHCHGIGDAAPTQVFESQGINLALSAERLRPGFFQRWMRDPLRIDPASRMPRYVDPQGRTGQTEVLDGEATAQWRAIWHVMHSLRTDR